MKMIIGGSGSGKSAYAESCITKLPSNCQKYYIATMQVYDEEGQAKIERHRMLRQGKGFITIEQSVNIEMSSLKMDDAKKEKKVALIECMSNLVANEMFSGEQLTDADTVMARIIKGIEALNKELDELVIVTNNVCEDGMNYDETTMEYIKAIGHVNGRLAAMADQVIEVVVGIPLVLKKK